RGKLVAQDPNDEPASVLLERIAAEKEELVKQKKIKKPKKLPPISEDEKPFELPDGWEWTRVGSVFNVVYGKGLPSTQLTESGFDVFGANGLIGFYSEYLYEDPQLLVSCRGAYSGKPNLSPQNCFVTSNSLVLEYTWEHLNQRYIYCYLEAVDKGQIVTGSAQPQVTATNLDPFLLNIPPLQEQHRIVAKVDELMALCDQLEQQTASSLDAHQTLVQTLLDTLLQSANAEELEQNWQRLSAHFDLLFTTEQSIDQLKQTILQLAVMGKLVPQDPNDEPASELLKRIAAEKDELVKQKKIKKQKPLPPINDDEKPFQLPKGWEWCRFYEFSNEIATGPFGSMIHKRDYVQNGIPLINPSHMINNSVIEDESISITSQKAQELSSYALQKNDLVTARRGELGRCALITEREHGWICGTGSFVIRFIDEVDRNFVLLLFAC
ncbi:MAG: restriction endonuclease subunit S, partial [Pseudomonadota bacterium]|nr:restriction endonuclease subunit S [Pseudomonadota bacterium]